MPTDGGTKGFVEGSLALKEARDSSRQPTGWAGFQTFSHATWPCRLHGHGQINLDIA